MKNSFFLFLLMMMFNLHLIFSQTDTILVRSDVWPNGGNLNRAIQNAANLGNLSRTVFKLELNSRYILSDSILVPPNEHLTIIAPEPGLIQEKAPPQILCASGEGEWGEFTSPFKMMFKCYGSITLKNLWLLFTNTKGKQVPVNIQFEHSSEATKIQEGLFENVIFDYSSVPWNASGTVGLSTKHFKGTFRNCYWKNCSDGHFRYYGRAVSFPFNSPGWHVDSLIFENCTFANIGYVLMQEDSNYTDYVKFNHCTFLNVVMFTLESGWWKKLAVTNCLWVNGFMFGDIPFMSILGGCETFGATLEIDSVSSFGFSVPFSDQDRRILFTNSSYYIEKWLNDWMLNNPMSLQYLTENRIDEIPVPQPMLNSKTIMFFDSTENGIKLFPYMNKRNLIETVNPLLISPPTDSNAIKGFLYHKWYDCCDSAWAWKPENSINYIWPLEENLAYTNQELLTAGLNEFPLGDLYRWFRDKYIEWKLQIEAEEDTINKWLNYGFTSMTGTEVQQNVPDQFKLFQNYPNPFNSITKIGYDLPVMSIVTIRIFNMLGQVIKTISNGLRQQGSHQIEVNGDGMSSGIYFCRLEAKYNQNNVFTDIKKIVLAK